MDKNHCGQVDCNNILPDPPKYFVHGIGVCSEKCEKELTRNLKNPIPTKKL